MRFLFFVFFVCVVMKYNRTYTRDDIKYRMEPASSAIGWFFSPYFIVPCKARCLSQIHMVRIRSRICGCDVGHRNFPYLFYFLFFFYRASDVLFASEIQVKFHYVNRARGIKGVSFSASVFIRAYKCRVRVCVRSINRGLTCMHTRQRLTDRCLIGFRPSF